MPLVTLLDPEIPAARDHDETKPVDVPVIRPVQLTGASLGAGIRLLGCIGEGASALVYRGVDVDGNPTAVKVLRERSNFGNRRRFVQEFEVLSRVCSPHVVRARARGQLSDGRPWYTMDYVPGHSLAHRLARGWHPSPAHVVALLRMACRGLAAIHATGFVHHDVKPSNLLVLRRGPIEHLVVVDLGVAEPIGHRPRHMCGTPDYMAPEQAEHSPVDVRSDVYGLGCCAFELLTGRKLVTGSDVSEKIRHHLRGVVPQWPAAPTLHPELRGVVERCLLRDPKVREPCMLSLERALGYVAAELAHERPARRTALGRGHRLLKARCSALGGGRREEPRSEASTVTLTTGLDQTLAVPERTEVG